jgi:hypothetical protein
MSLVRAAGRSGRALQALVRPSGITFPSVEATTDLLPATLRPVDVRLDGVVLRLTATRTT